VGLDWVSGPAWEMSVGVSVVDMLAECAGIVCGSVRGAAITKGVKMPTGLHLGTKSSLVVGLYTL